MVLCFHLMGARWKCLNYHHHKHVSDIFLLKSYHHYEVIVCQEFSSASLIHGAIIYTACHLTEGSEGGPHYTSITRAHHCP